METRQRSINQELPVREYCGGAEAVGRIGREEWAHPEEWETDAVWTENQIHVVLKTARNWAGPFGRFHPTVLADNPMTLSRRACRD